MNHRVGKLLVLVMVVCGDFTCKPSSASTIVTCETYYAAGLSYLNDVSNTNGTISSYGKISSEVDRFYDEPPLNRDLIDRELLGIIGSGVKKDQISDLLVVASLFDAVESVRMLSKGKRALLEEFSAVMGAETRMAPIHASAWCESYRVFEYLVSNNVNRDVNGRVGFMGYDGVSVSALELAVVGHDNFGGDIRIVRELSRSGDAKESIALAENIIISIDNRVLGDADNPKVRYKNIEAIIGVLENGAH